MSQCKLTSDDSRGLLSMFGLNVRPKAGPVRHVHRREDEWFYVAEGDFVLKSGMRNSSLRQAVVFGRHAIALIFVRTLLRLTES